MLKKIPLFLIFQCFPELTKLQSFPDFYAVRFQKTATSPALFLFYFKFQALLFTSSVLGAAAERHSDDTAAEGYEQGMMVLIQLQSQNPPVLLSVNVTPGHTGRQKADYIK